MNALEIIKNQIANEFGYSDWYQMQRVDPESCLENVDEVAIRYNNYFNESV